MSYLLNSRCAPNPRRTDRGSAVITVLILAAVTAVLASSFLFRSAQEAKLATRSVYQSVALNLAEAGIEEGVYAANTSGFTSDNGWTRPADTTDVYTKSITTGFNFQQATGAIYVRVDGATSPSPVFVAAGVIRIPNQPSMVKQIRVGASSRQLLTNGMVAKGIITFSGNALVDSYDSSLGPYDAFTNRSDLGTVATASTATDSLIIDSKATIYGYVATGGADPDVGKNGRIYGATTPSTTNVDPARVRKDFAANIPDVTAPAGSATSLGTITANTTLPRPGDTPGADGRYLYSASAITLDHEDGLSVMGPVTIIVTGSILVKSHGSVTVGGAGSTNPSLNLYAAGSVNFSAKGLKNSTNTITNTILYGTAPAGTAQSITIAHDGDFVGTIYAPNADLKLTSGGDIIGAVVAKTISLSNKSTFHYDVKLRQFSNGSAGGAGAVRVSAWAELTAAPTSSGDAFARDSRPPFSVLF